MTERYLVPATLTDEQCDALEDALSEAEGIRDPFDKWPVICRAIGTLVADIALAGQSDADVLIGALQVEIKRLSEELAREEKAQCEIIKERDDAEDALSRMYQSVMGEPPEWSSGFGFESAISDTEEYVQVLRQRARTIATQPVYQYRVGSYWMDTTKIFFDARVQAGQETRTLHKEIQPPSARTDRERLDAVPSLIAQRVAELPDRTSPDDAPDMMLVTSGELTDIIYASIADAMGQEGQGDE